MKIGVLTSSRADFGIYLPLLKALREDSFFQLELIVFGTHLSRYHGYTIEQIIDEGFIPTYQIHQMLLSDESNAISTSYALTALKFAEFWKEHSFSLVFCLGDRFEMAAAVAAGIPFNVRFGHIHGGETTLGAIDNIYRHSITLASKYHFVSAEVFKQRIKELTGTDENCIVTGSLSLLNLKNLSLLSIEKFHEKWGIDLSKPSILITIHPETVAFERNQEFAMEAYTAFEKLSIDLQLIITMPNADTTGTIFRNTWQTLKNNHLDNVFLIENFGTQSYFSCMKYVGLVIGNSSSGIIEAASFGKYFINIGERQRGRLINENTINCTFNSDDIIKIVNKYKQKNYFGNNVYDNIHSITKTISFLKEIS